MFHNLHELIEKVDRNWVWVILSLNPQNITTVVSCSAEIAAVVSDSRVELVLRTFSSIVRKDPRCDGWWRFSCVVVGSTSFVSGELTREFLRSVVLRRRTVTSD